MKSESPQSLFTAYDTEVKYVFTEAAYESPLTASHAGPLRVKSAGKDRDRALIYYPGWIDPDYLWMYHLRHCSTDVAVSLHLGYYGSLHYHGYVWRWSS